MSSLTPSGPWQVPDAVNTNYNTYTVTHLSEFKHSSLLTASYKGNTFHICPPHIIYHLLYLEKLINILPVKIPFLECNRQVAFLSPGSSVHENPLWILWILILKATMQREWYISVLPLESIYFTENFSLSLLFQPFNSVLPSDHTHLPEIIWSHFAGLGMIYKKIGAFP